jgi:hypothetical protein
MTNPVDVGWVAARICPSTTTDGELPIGSLRSGSGGHGEGLRRNRWRCRRGTAECLTRRPNTRERGNHLRPFRGIPLIQGGKLGIGTTSTEGAGGAAPL